MDTPTANHFVGGPQSLVVANVFIDLDSQLVAPLIIEDDDVIISVLIKNIKKGSLAISRTPLKEIKGFFYKFF